jgi:hypothetical protein
MRYCRLAVAMRSPNTSGTGRHSSELQVVRGIMIKEPKKMLRHLLGEIRRKLSGFEFPATTLYAVA